MSTAVVSREQWIEARLDLLDKEKQLTRARDEVNRQRRALPRVRVESDYVFDTDGGRRSLVQLFDGRSQLVVYHFMFGAEDTDGCPHCSFWADSFDGTAVHLAHRDTTFVLASRAPLAALQAYKKRMGWDLDWVSTLGTEFNYDLGVSFTADQQRERCDVQLRAGWTIRCRTAKASACSRSTRVVTCTTRTRRTPEGSTR